MYRSFRTQISVAILCGVILAIISVFLLSYAFAIPVPGWVLGHPFTVDNTAAVLRFWDAFVVYLLGVGIPSFFMAFVLFKFVVNPKWVYLACMLAGFIIYVHFVSPLSTGDQILVPALRDFPWYAALIGNLVICGTAAMVLVRRFSYNNGFNSDAGKARAG